MYEELTDAQLFELFREGVEEPFTIVYEKYKPRLYVYIRNLIPEIPPDEIGDIIQDTFLKAIEKANSYKKKYAFSTWIYTIARNKALDRRKKLKNKLPELPERDPTPEEVAEENQEKENLLKNLEKISREYREIILLRAEGFSYKEISKIMFIPERVAITRMHRGLKKLKEMMQNDGRENKH